MSDRITRNCEDFQRENVELHLRLIALEDTHAIKNLHRRVMQVLEGIDEVERDTGSGWWETKADAQFGKGILDKINAIFYTPTDQN
jgi:hypothetical protein